MAWEERQDRWADEGSWQRQGRWAEEAEHEPAWWDHSAGSRLAAAGPLGRLAGLAGQRLERRRQLGWLAKLGGCLAAGPLGGGLARGGRWAAGPPASARNAGDAGGHPRYRAASRCVAPRGRAAHARRAPQPRRRAGAGAAPRYSSRSSGRRASGGRAAGGRAAGANAQSAAGVDAANAKARSSRAATATAAKARSGRAAPATTDRAQAACSGASSAGASTRGRAAFGPRQQSRREQGPRTRTFAAPAGQIRSCCGAAGGGSRCAAAATGEGGRAATGKGGRAAVGGDHPVLLRAAAAKLRVGAVRGAGARARRDEPVCEPTALWPILARHGANARSAG